MSLHTNWQILDAKISIIAAIDETEHLLGNEPIYDMPSPLEDVFDRLVVRDNRRTEAEVQADVRQFILDAPFQLEDDDLDLVQLESQLGDRRRIDVEVGATVIEVKRDLRPERVISDAEKQLAGYVGTRSGQTGLRYVGVLTDGTSWHCYHLVEDELQPVSDITLRTGDLERLVVWLEGVLATTQDITPTADTIEARLGSTSSSYLLDRATLSAIYARNKEVPSVQMKRTLWARLLASALGTQFEDTDDLFIEHTMLVNSAEIIAHAVLGLQPEKISPAALLAGEKFDESGIYGVVEQDFFDWVVEVEEGPAFTRTLSKRLSRFDWSAVEQDVLKVLYESIIGADTRKRLGEYYTPDWLAYAVVTEVVVDPLSERVLDPACGSGTFLFHAIRRYMQSADALNTPVGEQIEGVTRQVLGMDLHPVAVTLARVTYLLAIGRRKLTDPSRGTIQIPVYLGDSMQWQEQATDLWAAGHLTIRTDDRRELFETELRFPDVLLDDAARFDELVNELASRASGRRTGSAIPSLSAVYRRLAIAPRHHDVIDATFSTMCRLHDEGRDHIWGYYVRNLARPMWLAREANRVDVLISNPPWLAYRNMTTDMQTAFKRMSEISGLWAGAALATHQDLSCLFTVRSCQLYLRTGGRFGMVLPNSAIDREHYNGFRTGHYGDSTIGMSLTLDEPWDLRRLRPHFFPRAASVAFGCRAAAQPMPGRAEVWEGRLPAQNASWDVVRDRVSRAPAVLSRASALSRSPYASAFTQGAIFSPHFVFAVQEQAVSALGMPAGRISIRSSRSVYEKKPWKELDDVTGVVESEFVRPCFSGDSIFPYRTEGCGRVAVPCNSRGVMSRTDIEMSPGFNSWWVAAEQIWETHRRKDTLNLFEQLDYQSKLSKQFPIPELRIVYNRAGMHLVCAKIKDRRALISNSLYWAAVSTESEADYLSAILNAPITTELARPFMSYGKDERDIHKHFWELPIPTFDQNNPMHARLAALGSEVEQIARAFPMDDNLHFAATRRHMRQHIQATPQGREIDELVYEMIS
ncbi:MAG: N-6 DNA methylase [Pseudomonadota bacterium]